jgi:hypothetical protein
LLPDSVAWSDAPTAPKNPSWFWVQDAFLSLTKHKCTCLSYQRRR